MSVVAATAQEAASTVVHADGLLEAAAALKDDGFRHLDLLTAVERTDGEGVELLCTVVRRADGAEAALRVTLDDDSLEAPSVSAVWPAAEPLEREVYDLFGVVFTGHPHLRRIVLRDDFVGHPLRKAYAMPEGGVSAETVATAARSHGGDGATAPATGDPLVLNMGPQHPSTHGVLHVEIELDGERVVSARPTHGYLHRCIEKLSEMRTYRGVGPLLDRCDYVSGFHTELAYVLALEDLLGIESTPKADHLRVLMGELIRITSHHTWLAAAGLDTGALTPFLYAFIDREELLDVFEAVTGGRMMFDYFRPGGVRADLQPEVAEKLRGFLAGFDRKVDEYEALLTGNEVFRARTRGIGMLTRDDAEAWAVTGPAARGSGWDIDLRRDAPYSAYDRFEVRVPLGEVGDTFDRYTVRMAEMRESARIALDALEGMPEGPHIAENVPRVIKPPAGSAYRKVESPRGELGVLVVSDGSDHPWRLKVRSPALSNVHATPRMVAGCLLGDVVPVIGSIDIVMGEIDR